jgi:very-short-patch-repair endonuclease
MEAPKLTIARAKDLRRKLTLPEVILWSAIRGRRLANARFRRQHPIGPYILDFYCDDARLALEIDGDGHEHPDQAAHDLRRTAWLEARGITVYRIAARNVLSNLEGVLQSIAERVRGVVASQCAAPPPPPPLCGPPPPTGEDLG